MAQDFKLKINSGIKDFAEGFVAQLGPVMTMAMLHAGEQMRESLGESTLQILSKNPKGRLAASWTPGPVKTSAGKWTISVTSPLPYAMIHETGGVIRPKRVKALAIPDRNYSPIIRNNAPIAPREFDPGRTLLEFKPVRNPGRVRGLLVDVNTGERAYTLVAHSRIYPTSYISKAVDTALPEIELVVEGALEAAKIAAARGA